MEKKKTKKAVLICLAILLTALTAFSGLGLASAVKEMRHEGLTYSQWYEGSVNGYYACLLVLILCVCLTAAAWIAVFKNPPRSVSRSGLTFLKACVCVFAIAACAFTFLAFWARAEWRQAAEMNVEGLTYYIRVFWRYRIGAMLSIFGCLTAVYQWLRRRKLPRR